MANVIGEGGGTTKQTTPTKGGGGSSSWVGAQFPEYNQYVAQWLVDSCVSEKTALDIINGRLPATRENVVKYAQILSDATKNYIALYGSKNLEGFLGAQALAPYFAPARALSPNVDIDDITRAEWLLAAGQVLSLAALPASGGGSMWASRVLQLGATAAFTGYTVDEWDRMSNSERALSVILDTAMAASVLGEPFITQMKRIKGGTDLRATSNEIKWAVNRLVKDQRGGVILGTSTDIDIDTYLARQRELTSLFEDVNRYIETNAAWGELDRASVEAEKIAGMIAREGDMLSDLGMPRAVIPQVINAQIGTAARSAVIAEIISGTATEGFKYNPDKPSITPSDLPSGDIPTPGQVVGDILTKPPAPEPYTAPSKQTPSVSQPAVDYQLSTGIAVPVGTQAPIGWTWVNGEWYNEYGVFMGMEQDFPYTTPNTQPIEVTQPLPQTTEVTQPQPSTVVNPDAAEGFQIETQTKPQYHQEFTVYPQVTTKTLTQPRQKTDNQPEISTQPKTEPQPKVEPKPSTKTEDTVMTSSDIATDIVTDRNYSNRRNIRFLLPDGSGDEIMLTPEQLKGAIAWKQGIMFKLWLPPYNESTMINTRQPIQGITYHSGYRAAYDSVKAIGGDVPDGLTYNMGIMDIEFTDKDKDNQPEIAFTLDKSAIPNSAWGDDDGMRVTPPAFSIIPARTVRKQHKKAKHNKRHGNPSVIMGW